MSDLTVFKYEIPPPAEGGYAVEVLLPKYGSIIHVGAQGKHEHVNGGRWDSPEYVERIYAWVMCSPQPTLEHRTLYVFPTGAPITYEQRDVGRLGTVQMRNSLVWHVFGKAAGA